MKIDANPSVAEFLPSPDETDPAVETALEEASTPAVEASLADGGDASPVIADASPGVVDASLSVVGASLSIAGVAGASPEEVQEAEIEVWWPKDTGPFRRVAERKPQKVSKRPERPPQADGERHRKGKKPPRPPRELPAVTRKPERPPDPLSPFAVLGSLKANFDKN